MTATYTPNLNDPRVLKRIRTAYGFSRGCLSATPKQWAQKAIDKNFGMSANPLSKWLRGELIICTNNYYSKEKGIAKEYIANFSGQQKMREILLGEPIVIEENMTPLLTSSLPLYNTSRDTFLFDRKVVSEWATRAYGAELSASKFSYLDAADRLWHPIQNIRSEFRAPILAEHGFNWNYDIVACAPTLILQHAQHNEMDLWLHALQEYLKDRTKIREHIANSAGISLKQAKTLINALFCGARLGANKDYALFHLLECNRNIVKILQDDEFIIELKSNIKTCWEYIEPTLGRIEVISPKTGKTRKVPLNSKRKWACYFRLERKVMDAVQEFLKINSNEVFLEHDGWRTKNQIDLIELVDFVREKTGFKIQVDEEHVSNNI